MPYDPEEHSGRLRRLNPDAYRGISWVHWTMGIEGRKTGWLTTEHHLQFREIFLHSLIRQNLVCPVYCLMPDHAHFLLGGCSSKSDQRTAIKFLRQQWNRLLKQSGDFSLQLQAYDHVLDEKEQKKSSFQNTAAYLIENPVRAKLVENPGGWPFLGSLVPGYPALSPLDEKFWELFWKLYYANLDASKD